MELEVREMKCDWCGLHKECSIWRDTFYWVCMDCALKSFFEKEQPTKDEEQGT